MYVGSDRSLDSGRVDNHHATSPLTCPYDMCMSRDEGGGRRRIT